MFLFIQATLIIITFILLYVLLRRTFTANRELKNSTKNLNSIFDTLDVAIWSHDLVNDQLLITPGIEKLYGYKLDDFYQDKLLWKKVINPEDLHVLKEREKNFIKGEPFTSVYRIIKPDGQVRWIQDRGFPTLDKNGHLVYFSSVLFDITERKESEDQYRNLVEMSPDIIAVITDYRFSYINESGSKVLGANNPCDVVGMSLFRFANKIDVIRALKRVGSFTSQTNNTVRLEASFSSLDGKLIDIEISLRSILYEGRSAFQLVGRDITERKKSERIIHQMAYYDSLTGIPNRNKFKQELGNILKNEANKSFAILFLDLDRFKTINDTKGHSTGDMILKQVAIQLKNVLAEDGEVFRQGGDEFIILVDNTNKDEVVKIAERILQVFTKPLSIGENDYFVTPSIGISMYPIDGDDQDTLIKHADTAMYLAKERGKNNYQFYDPLLDEIAYRKVELEDGLRRAIELNELTLHYQPKVNLETGKVPGVEALLRWNHKDLGTISPTEFIPLAEESGLIIPIGKWVIKKACEQSKQWENSQVGILPIAVNLSVRQIQDTAIVEDIKSIIDEVGIPPNRLELEITESIMQDDECSIGVLYALQKMGIGISIDDFGTGYSSLSKLRYLPIDTLKIDKSFVDDIGNFNNQGSIVKAIIDMGQNLNFNIIAEGIETEEQVKFLYKNSCQIGQGYYYSKPLPADELERFLLNQVK